MAIILIGTTIFAVLGALGFLGANACGQMSGLGRFIAVTTAFCCWCAWVCVYMSQQYPLIVPLRKVADASKGVHHQVADGSTAGHGKAKEGKHEGGHH